MNKTMRTAVMTGIGQLAWETRPVPVPQDHEVLVKIQAVGICGSDLHYYEHGRISDFIVEPPFVLGHECAGVVVRAGDAVRHLRRATGWRWSPEKPAAPANFADRALNLCPDVIFFHVSRRLPGFRARCALLL